ncbi:MAG: DUF1343 domain-containing protein [Saprospiraceae bacterium]|nr:DUF1343 domain-containing protein [Saprospiraceae bacterium]
MIQNTSLDTFLEQIDLNLIGSIGVLCNQTAFSFNKRRYLLQLLHDRGVLKKAFIPEHGLFAELQDQEHLDITELYNDFLPGIPFFSLYQSDKENSLQVPADELMNLDALVIDLQDVGSRYYTYLSTLNYLFKTVAKQFPELPIFILDRKNPSGRQIEGSVMPSDYTSFVGLEGLPHRHGLTIGEMATYFSTSTGHNLKIKVIDGENYQELPIAPSPNIPELETCLLYPGQCLVEGTILSEGRGTTKPFQLIGAPFLNWSDLTHIGHKMEEAIKPYDFINRGVILRPLIFIPKFHKWTDQHCFGFQLHLTGLPFHSLLYSAILLRIISEIKFDRDIWRKGSYEYGNVRTAIELLAGDRELLYFLQGKVELRHLVSHFAETENEWITTVKNYFGNSLPVYSLIK